jgi:hypothetical protein
MSIITSERELRRLVDSRRLVGFQINKTQIVHNMRVELFQLFINRDIRYNQELDDFAYQKASEALSGLGRRGGRPNQLLFLLENRKFRELILIFKCFVEIANMPPTDTTSDQEDIHTQRRVKIDQLVASISHYALAFCVSDFENSKNFSSNTSKLMAFIAHSYYWAAKSSSSKNQLAHKKIIKLLGGYYDNRNLAGVELVTNFKTEFAYAIYQGEVKGNSDCKEALKFWNNFYSNDGEINYENIIISPSQNPSEMQKFLSLQAGKAYFNAYLYSKGSGEVEINEAKAQNYRRLAVIIKKFQNLNFRRITIINQLDSRDKEVFRVLKKMANDQSCVNLDVLTIFEEALTETNEMVQNALTDVVISLADHEERAPAECQDYIVLASKKARNVIQKAGVIYDEQMTDSELGLTPNVETALAKLEEFKKSAKMYYTYKLLLNEAEDRMDYYRVHCPEKVRITARLIRKIQRELPVLRRDVSRALNTYKEARKRVVNFCGREDELVDLGQTDIYNRAIRSLMFDWRFRCNVSSFLTKCIHHLYAKTDRRKRLGVRKDQELEHPTFQITRDYAVPKSHPSLGATFQGESGQKHILGDLQPYYADSPLPATFEKRAGEEYLYF